ncbi:MAG: 50S ribosomal protein L31e [Nanoarchaeota archaeon]|nr:50S ribosomal protein L31e [Nanoarchaeota archaeon]
MAKQPASILERTYTVPLRKEFRKSPRWKRTKKAVIALREFLVKHMKSDHVRIGKELNEALWVRGIKNPPHKVKLIARKDAEGVVTAELFGVQKEEPKESKKEKAARKEKKKEAMAESTATKEEKTETVKEEA